ncbi:PaREP1 family protein [Caldivirga maquilingensis]|uniref:PaREP1 protein n=1 Tax=Caldivirga maquilingensis (strain ATCC 700844 / DSM 13496 / JCM 10307 / IC-167) TaxID=397948 RepID=A8MAD7_CALMQ|nr:PaREP1 family protein [Caldivirga maquilingensis]ABW02514.1 PaREP1 protein [Caldivirga maquilingensis IC-167]
MRVHLNINEISELRLNESRIELELAKVFLRSGLLRSAAFNTIQAWRAYLSYLASINSDLIKVRGFKRIRGNIEVNTSELIIATMPIKLMMTITEHLRNRDPELMELTALVLLIREYLCAGACRDSTSRVIDDEAAKGIMAKLITKLEKRLMQVK